MANLNLSEYNLDDAVLFIARASKQIKCSVRTRSKALLIYHQFKKCIGETSYDPSLLAAACLSLSVKSNNENIELDAILQTSFCIEEGIRKSMIKSEFKLVKESLITMEHIILRIIDFYLNHHLAYEYLLYFLFDVHQELEAMKIWFELVEHCLKLTSDFYLSSRCLNYKAEEIAISAIQVAFYLLGVNIEECSPYFKTWFKHLKENSKKEDIFEDFFRICVIGAEAERRRRG